MNSRSWLRSSPAVTLRMMACAFCRKYFGALPSSRRLSTVTASRFLVVPALVFAVEQRAFGFYTSADYQLGRRWFLGGRFDRSARSKFANLTDNGGSIVLTYWPSEFSQIRGQYRYTDYAENRSANELLLQVIFSLGAHGAHPF